MTEEFVVEVRPGFPRAEHEILSAQIGEFERGLSRQRMLLRQGDLEGHPPYDLVIESIQRHREHHEGDVEAAFAQRLELLSLQAVEVVEFNLGMSLAKPGDDRRQVIEVKSA